MSDRQSVFANEKWISFIACPDCTGPLRESEGYLQCRCGKRYEVADGIPLLYPSDIDANHLREEECLAEVMTRTNLSSRDEFSSLQWEISKKEFWSVVKANIMPPPMSILNIGCGFDKSFKEYEHAGYDFVNFDIVYRILSTLRKECHAISCVAGDVKALPFRNESFDYVISIDTIHHEVSKLRDVLDSFRKILKVGGCLFLEDPNSWAVFQLMKTVVLTRPLHRWLRSSYHRIKHSTHRPADYEFPTSIWHVRNILKELGFCEIKVYPSTSYPNVGPLGHCVWGFFAHSQWIRKYHNWHYIISARRGI